MRERQLEEERRRQEIQLQIERQEAIRLEKEKIARDFEEAATYHENMAQNLRRQSSETRVKETLVSTSQITQNFSPTRNHCCECNSQQVVSPQCMVHQNYHPMGG